jgi:transposase-like protein
MDEIDVCFIDGQLESAFIVGVKANIFHGLPLSLPDRRAAATRILRTHPEWSDRAIGDSTGLSARTVHAVRLSNEQYQKPDKRLGKDGRLRPLDASVGRKLAADLLSERPEASLREIADAAGVSPGTVRDVRDRLRRGDDPVPSSEGDKHETTPPTKAPPKIIAHIACKALDVNPVLRTLARDPALSMNCTGRELLRWLHVHAVNSADTAKLSSSLPEHCIEHLVELAIRCSANWAAIAQHLAKPPLAEPPLA